MTMSKKRFTDGLESLFGADSKSENERLLIVDDKSSGRTSTKTEPKSSKKKRKSRKSFTSDLDTLFDDVMTAIEAEPEVETPKAAPGKKARTARPKPSQRIAPTGLDALIRRTVEATAESTPGRDRKRLTLTLDRAEVAKLKRIARHQKSYLRDIVGELVNDYIKRYEHNNGKVEDLF